MRRRRKQALGVVLVVVLITGCAPWTNAAEPTTASTTTAGATTTASTATPVSATTDATTTTAGAATTTDATNPASATNRPENGAADSLPNVRDLPPPDLPEDLHYVFQRAVSNAAVSNAAGSNAAGSNAAGSADEAALEWEIVLGLPDGGVVPLLRGDGEWSYVQPMVSPDGRYLSVIGSEINAAGGGETAIFVAEMSDLQAFRPVEATLGRFVCPRWAYDGQSMTVTREVGRDQWRVSSVDIVSGVVSDVLDDSFAADVLPCGVLVDDETYLYYALKPETGDVGVRRRNLETSDDVSILVIPDCNTVHPILRPNTDQVAVVSRCSDDRLDGLRLVSLADRSVERVLNGLVGAPAWSPDGNWILFSHAVDPIPTQEQEADLWIARADGSQATRLQSAFVGWPTWLPAEFDCPDCPGSSLPPDR